MLGRIWRSGLISLCVLMALLIVLFRPAKDTYQVILSEVQINEGRAEDEVILVFRGGNLLRVNSFFLDGKRIEDCSVSKVTHEECHVYAKAGLFGQNGSWHKLELGYEKWGLVKMRSTPLWIEWKNP